MAAVSEQEEFEFRRRAEMESAHAAPARSQPAADPRGLLGIIARRGNEGLSQMQQGGQHIMQGLGANGDRMDALGGVGDVVRGGWKALTAAPSGYVERAAGPAWNAATGGPSSGMGDFSDNMMALLLGGPKPKAPPPLSAAALAGVPKAKAFGDVLAKPRALLDAGATPAAEKVRAAAMGKALAQSGKIDSLKAEVLTKKAADKPLRQAMEDAASAKAEQGIGVSDVPEAQALVADLRGRLSPTGTVVTKPTADQAKVYQAVIDTLSPTKGQKPSLQQVQELRRLIQEPAKGDLQGFGAVNKIERQNLANELHKVENAYTGGASEPVRANWASLPDQKALKKAEKQGVVFKGQAGILDEMDAGPEAVTKAQSIMESYLKRGLITEPEYREFADLAKAATTAAKRSALIKRVALLGAGYAGLKATEATTGAHILGGILP
jgi:hypothetical protein